MIEKIHLSKTDEQLSNLIYRNEHTREHCLKHLNSFATNFTFSFRSAKNNEKCSYLKTAESKLILVQLILLMSRFNHLPSVVYLLAFPTKETWKCLLSYRKQFIK